ncbi:nucleoside-diphosphate-sugar epimerase [Kitasatospora sp. MAP12-15]|uniref:SDR family oxidoreductase n=1 Tax=unclassified Kitasatospora TaxID=2633591 RepID=UPI0024768158|nr:SDR family oxidoreductase [Kitasatospora sp. MAP12-44]MDH6115203.1 nucleoside-diphosphate-sugar epimerase [Kitasatospora sp. MAP12-44]
MRVLLTGATGVIGSELVQRLRSAAREHGGRHDHTLVRVARRAEDESLVRWRIGAEPPPAALAGHWDVIVHAAASTRWTLARDEAVAANIDPLRAVLALADRDTHLVQVSTAYVGGVRNPEDLRGAEFEGYRNGYEWSKAKCEELAREEHPGPLTLVRPPLVVGRRGSGAIARFSGPYTLLQALVSGLAAVVVGDPAGYAEISPVDEVATVLAAAVLCPPPSRPRTEVLAGGRGSLTLDELLDVVCTTLNECRTAQGVAPIERPPLVSGDSWDRFFRPLADQYLSPIQSQAVKLLAMFQSYTSMSEPFEPTWTVEDPAAVMAASVRYWAATRPRLALARPEPWTLLAKVGC